MNREKGREKEGLLKEFFKEKRNRGLAVLLESCILTCEILFLFYFI